MNYKPIKTNIPPPLVSFRGKVGYMTIGGQMKYEKGETHHGSYEETGVRQVRMRGETPYKETTD
jgi:hypothetical protein